MPKLIQLPDGTWVDPHAVQLVKVCEARDVPVVGRFPAQLIVVADGKEVLCLAYEDREDAVQARDDLARLVQDYT